MELTSAASLPLLTNVAVGGTDFSDRYFGTQSTYWNTDNSSTYESAKSYDPEIPWNDSCASVLIMNYYGYGVYTQLYGLTGFCQSNLGPDFEDTISGSGGPSACATGAPFPPSPAWLAELARDTPSLDGSLSSAIPMIRCGICLMSPCSRATGHGFTCTFSASPTQPMI